MRIRNKACALKPSHRNLLVQALAAQPRLHLLPPDLIIFFPRMKKIRPYLRPSHRIWIFSAVSLPKAFGCTCSGSSPSFSTNAAAMHSPSACNIWQLGLLQALQFERVNIGAGGDGRTYFFPVISATSKSGSSPIKCDDFRSLMPSNG